MTPSSSSDQLLQGEKGPRALAPAPDKQKLSGDPSRNAVPPSPLAGEGARRAGEGSSSNRDIRSPPRLKSLAISLRRRQTEPEQILWGILRNRRFSDFKFRRQVAIGPYVADFACYDARLIVELDGSQHAESRRDTVRDRWFADDGYRVLRIWNNDLTRNRTGVLEAIWSALQYPSSGPSDHLLPQGEK